MMPQKLKRSKNFHDKHQKKDSWTSAMWNGKEVARFQPDKSYGNIVFVEEYWEFLPNSTIKVGKW